MALYDNFSARYISFSGSSYSDPSQIKIREKKFLFSVIFRLTISFLGSHSLKIPNLSRDAEFHSFSPFYLDCLFKFILKKTVEKFVNFVGLPRLMRIDNYKDASVGSKTAQDCMR